MVHRVEQVRAGKYLRVRPRQFWYALLCPRQVLEQIGKLVVNLKLEHGKHLADGVYRVKRGRLRALGAVCHQVGGKRVCVVERLLQAHAVLNILQILRTRHHVAGEVVDRLHRHTGNIRDFARQRPVEELRSLAVGKKYRAVRESVILHGAFHRVTHGSDEVCRADLAARLCDRDKVRDPRAGVHCDHVRCHTSLNVLCHRIHLSADHFLPAAVCACLLARKVVDILMKVGNIAAHALLLLVVQLLDIIRVGVVGVLNLLVPFKRVQTAVVADLVYLLLRALVRKPVPQRVLKRAQLLYAVRQKDNVTGGFDVPVKACHRVIVSEFAFTLQQVAEPLLARLEVVRNTGNIRADIYRAVLAPAKAVANTRKQRVRLVLHEMRRIVLAGAYRLHAVGKQRFVE